VAVLDGPVAVVPSQAGDHVQYGGTMRRYRKIAIVLAELATEDGFIDTLEGRMEYKAGQHYIVSDDPPTHYWPVRRDIFEATYEELGIFNAARK
jgi:hypothetical protein